MGEAKSPHKQAACGDMMVTKESNLKKEERAASFMKTGFLHSTDVLEWELKKGLNLVGPLKTFADIPESWVDGGPSPSRRAEVVEYITRSDLVKRLNTVVLSGEAWLRYSPEEIKNFLPWYWKNYWGSDFGYTGNTPGFVYVAVASLRATISAFNEIAKDADYLSKNPFASDFTDRVESMLKSIKNVEGLAPNLGRALIMMSVGPELAKTAAQ